MKNKQTINVFSYLLGLIFLIQPLISFAAGHSLDELISSAQKEGEVATYWNSSRMWKKVAKAFEKKYGIKVL